MSETDTGPRDAVDEDQTLEPDDASAERVPWWQRFVTGSSTWIGLILVALIVAFSVLEYSSFVSASNARNIATDAAVLLVLATGMTFVIITAGVGLSGGAGLVVSGGGSGKAVKRVGGGKRGAIPAGPAGALLPGGGGGMLDGL